MSKLESEMFYQLSREATKVARERGLIGPRDAIKDIAIWKESRNEAEARVVENIRKSLG